MSHHARIIYSSANDDEELLIPTAKHIRQQEFVTKISKPPSCCFCLNTRCGTFFVAALQIACGIVHLFCCLAYYGVEMGMPSSQEGGSIGLQVENSNVNPRLALDKVGILEVGQTGDLKSISELDIAQEIQYADQCRLYVSTIIAVSSILSGLLVFHGLNFNKERLLRPAVFLYTLAIFACLSQFFYIIVYWEEVSAQLRDFLTFYTKNIESAIKNEITLETEQQLPTITEKEDLQVWQQIEFMISDDVTWATYTQGYLMTIISGVLMVYITVFSWFAWILVSQVGWMSRRRMFEL